MVADACNPSSWKTDTYQVPCYLKQTSKNKILNLHPIINTEYLLDVSKKLWSHRTALRRRQRGFLCTWHVARPAICHNDRKETDISNTENLPISRWVVKQMWLICTLRLLSSHVRPGENRAATTTYGFMTNTQELLWLPWTPHRSTGLNTGWKSSTVPHVYRSKSCCSTQACQSLRSSCLSHLIPFQGWSHG